MDVDVFAKRNRRHHLAVAIGAAMWIVAQIGWLDPAGAEVAAPSTGIPSTAPSHAKAASEHAAAEQVGVVDAFYAWVRDYVSKPDQTQAPEAKTHH